MKRAGLLFAVFAVSLSASAYQDGLYSCKNIDGLPDNTYKIRSVAVEGLTGKVPYVEIVRYRREKPTGNTAGAVVQSRIEGFATVVRSSSGFDGLMLAALNLEFQGDRLVGCQQ